MPQKIHRGTEESLHVWEKHNLWDIHQLLREMFALPRPPFQGSRALLSFPWGPGWTFSRCSDQKQATYENQNGTANAVGLSNLVPRQARLCCPQQAHAALVSDGNFRAKEKMAYFLFCFCFPVLFLFVFSLKVYISVFQTATKLLGHA